MTLGNRFRPGLSAHSRAVFFRIMALAFKSGLSLLNSLLVLSVQGPDPRLTAASLDMARRLETGRTLSKAMEAQGSCFTNLHLRLVEVGEVSGNLDTVLERLAEHEEKLHETAMKLRSSLSYPALVFVAASAMLVFLPPYLFGEFAKIFRQLDVPLPFITRVVMGISDVTRSPFFYATLIAGIFAAGAFLPTLARSYAFRRATMQFVLRLPAFGKLVRIVTTTRFARGLATLTESGINLLVGFRFAAEATSNLVFIERARAAEETFRNGASLSETLTSMKFFPPMFVQSVMVGEESGTLDIMLVKIADLYDQELDATLTAVTSLVEPLITLFIGILTGILVIATTLPLMHIVRSL